MKVVTFVAEKHENIVAFVLFTVALVRRIESGGAKGPLAVGHWAHFDGIEIDIAHQAETRGVRGIVRGTVKGSRCGAQPRGCFAAVSKRSWGPLHRERA